MTSGIWSCFHEHLTVAQWKTSTQQSWNNSLTHMQFQIKLESGWKPCSKRQHPMGVILLKMDFRCAMGHYLYSDIDYSVSFLPWKY